MIELGEVDRFVPVAVGEPGYRTFYIAIEIGRRAYWFLAEKQQVAVLAEQSLQLVRDLGRVSEATEMPILEEAEPEAVRFRVGNMALAFSPDDEMATVILQPMTESEGQSVAFKATLEQLEAAAVHAIEVLGAGRPSCAQCHLPVDPKGHICPALNGDRRRSQK